MPQTLLALLAMILTSLLAFSQQRGSINNYGHMVGNEMEMAASGAIMTVLEFVGSRSFDERTTPGGINSTRTLPTDVSELSSVGQFGTYDRGSDSCDLMEPFRTPECDDIDDVDGISGQIISVTLSTGMTLDFVVNVDIDYVSDTNFESPTADKTWNKRVVVTASNEMLQHGDITMTRVFSYDPIDAEADYEAIYGPIDYD